MPDPHARFLAVGDLLVDVIASGRGHSAATRLGPGGSAGNAAAWAASLGAESTVVGAVGDDPGGRLLRSELERYGVRTRLVVDPASPTGTFVLAEGEVRVDRGANATLGAGNLPELPEADAVLVSGYLPRAALEAALERAVAPWVALDAAALDQLPDGGNVLFANEERARSLTGMEAARAASALANRYRLVCVTLGEHGVVAVLDGSVEHATPADSSTADVPGAGDAFAAGVLVSLARGAQLAEAVAVGCRCGGAVSVSRRGWPTETRLSP